MISTVLKLRGRKVMMLTLRILLILIASLYLKHGASAQLADGTSTANSDTLRGRFELYLSYQRTKNWEKLYDLLDEKREKQVFVQDQVKNPNNADLILMDFSSIKLKNDKSLPKWITIHGCATVRFGKKREKKFKAFVTAYELEHIWKFSLPEFTRQVGMAPEPCK